MIGQQYKSVDEKDSDTPPMSFAFQLARQTTRKTLGVRAFHSPFAVLGTSPLTTPHPPSPEVDSNTISAQYEKQYDHAHHEPTTTHGGYRTYVVSEPDSSYKHYQVPAGAYPTSAPYINFNATAAPDTAGVEYSSTGGELLAHGFTTRAARHHSGGVGESAAVRFKAAPGEMGARGGSYGGVGMMDREGTMDGTGKLGERNPQPDDPNVAETFSKAGLDGAWKLRK